MIAAEQSAGWLAECDDARRFLAVSRELVGALALALRQLAGDGPVLEICAGSGELACSLAAAGLSMQATDAHAGPGGPAGPEDAGDIPQQVPSGGQSPHTPRPSKGSAVLRMPADAALRRFQPTVVLGVFVPFDAGVDEAVLASASVRHYVILNARIGGSLGSPLLRQATDWKAERLESVRRWMLTRHDVWLGESPQPGWSEPFDLYRQSDFAQQEGKTECRRPGRSFTDLLQHGEAWHFRRISDKSFHDI